jgi:hypothetical protein
MCFFQYSRVDGVLYALSVQLRKTGSSENLGFKLFVFLSTKTNNKQLSPKYHFF